MRFYDRIAILRVEADIDVKLQLERCKIAYGVFIRGIESFKNQEINGIDHTYLDAIHSIFLSALQFYFSIANTRVRVANVAADHVDLLTQ